MRVRSDVSYCLNRTLLGHKLIVGIKEKNSFVNFSGDVIPKVISFIDRYKEKDIEDEELGTDDKRIAKSLDKIGYLNTSELPSRESFNEFRKVGKLFLQIRPKWNQAKAIGNNRIGTLAFYMSALLLIGFCAYYRSYLPDTIDYVHMKLWEILFTILVFPPLILAMHELGHCLVARYQGVQVASISLGWFFIYPIVLVQYRGINLESQRQKLTVIAGGVYMNLALAAMGVGLKLADPAVFSGAVVDIWIMANLSTILTNLGLFGMTDGYFIFTTLVGAMDLRMKGYKFIHSKLGRKKAAQPLDKSYTICGWLLIGLYVYGIINLYIQANYISSLFMISEWAMLLVLSFLIIGMTVRFIQRIRKAF